MKYLLLIAFLLPACHQQTHATTPTKTDFITAKTPNVSFTALHKLPEDETRTAAESLARSLEKYGLKWSWQNNTINFEATSGILNGVHGTLTLQYPHVTVDIYNIPKFIPNSIVTRRVSGRIQTYFNID